MTLILTDLINHLVGWIAGEPQSEDWRGILRSEFFTDLLEHRHPRHRQVAVLQQHPRAVLFGLVYHASSNRTLVNINTVKYIQGGQKISKNYAFYVCLWLCDIQVWCSPLIPALELTMSLNLLSSTHWQTNTLETRAPGEPRPPPRRIWTKSGWLSKFNWKFLHPKLHLRYNFHAHLISFSRDISQNEKKFPISQCWRMLQENS